MAQSSETHVVPPDMALCAECARELFDPTDRRFRYPFISCSACGPRFSIAQGVPLARERTSMGAFEQCRDCRDEYRDPGGRRYRAAANSCQVCGPHIEYEIAGEMRVVAHGVEAIRYAARDLLRGRIVALRGPGGFELAVDATSDEGVRQLRERKARDQRPFAVLVRTVDEARQLGVVDAEEERCLSSRERPIVILRLGAESGLAPSVAPGFATVGVKLAGVPLHVLLLEFVKRPIAIAGGRLGDEPVLTARNEARRRLQAIADRFLTHDLEIVTHCGDSRLQVVGGKTVLHRRARGYVPQPTALPVPAPRPLVAVGPQRANTFTLANESAAYVSQPIGDLRAPKTWVRFLEALESFRRLTGVVPEVCVGELGPVDQSPAASVERGFDAVSPVQHHHAHVAAVAGEHGIRDRVVGVVLDGGSVGEDGTLWGGEILVSDLEEYERRASLRPAPLPGGLLAAGYPWRSALGYLSLEPAAAAAFAKAFEGVDDAERAVVDQRIAERIEAPLASSAARLFDAAAAVLGVRRVSSYTAQAAMELEALAGQRSASPLPFPVETGDDGLVVLDPLPLLVALGERRAAGDEVADLAARFHESVAAALAEVVHRTADHTGIAKVVLCGGVFHNVRLLASLISRLEAHILDPLVPRQLPPNNGGVSFGQAVVAAARMADESG